MDNGDETVDDMVKILETKKQHETNSFNGF